MNRWRPPRDHVPIPAGHGPARVGAISSSVCYAPQKQVKSWSWQTYWLTQASFCWFLLPILGAVLTIPHLGEVLAEAPKPRWSLVCAGHGLWHRRHGLRHLDPLHWFLADLCHRGRPVERPRHADPAVGQARTGPFLGVAGSLGTGEAVRAARPEGFSEILAKTGAAGSWRGSSSARSASPVRDRRPPEGVRPAGKGEATEFSLAKGLLLSLLAGVLSAVYGFSLEAGEPIADVAPKYGADVYRGNVTYIFSNTGAFVTTAIYCLYLHLGTGTLGELVDLPAGAEKASLPMNFAMAALTGLLWYAQFFFYNLGHVRMGEYKFTSWAIHMIMLVLASNLIAILFREWKGCRHFTRRHGRCLGRPGRRHPGADLRQLPGRIEHLTNSAVDLAQHDIQRADDGRHVGDQAAAAEFGGDRQVAEAAAAARTRQGIAEPSLMIMKPIWPLGPSVSRYASPLGSFCSA